LGKAAGKAGVEGRSIPREFVEEAIQKGVQKIMNENGVVRTTHTLGTLSVVTEDAGRIVVTLIAK
jgi:hypothetical protein